LRLVLVALLALTGCTIPVARLGVVTTREADAVAATPPVRVHARDCMQLVTIVPIRWPPNLGVAIERALDASGRRVLSDVEVRYRFFYVPLLYGEACYEVEGDA
jgi:hypothetical protein